MKLEEIPDLMRENLRQLPIFNETHKVAAKKLDDNKIWIGYRTTNNFPRGTTYFDLNIIGTTCYVLWIELKKEQRGKNLGRSLFKAIEDFAKNYGCDKVILTPSGYTPSGKTRLEYMKSLGYHELGRNEVEKILKQVNPFNPHKTKL